MPITLAPVVPAHAEALQRLVTSDPAIVAHTRLPAPYPPNGVAQWVAHVQPRHQRGEEYQFALLDAGGGPVGVCGFIPFNNGHSAELGFWVGRPYWGRGYATAGARQAVAFAFEVGIERVTAQALARNVASRRVLEKAGLRLVRLETLQEARWSDEDRLALYELLRPV